MRKKLVQVEKKILQLGQNKEGQHD